MDAEPIGRLWQQRIVADPAIMLGKPVIAGTRITVELILERLAYGSRIEEILDSYPRLDRDAITAALAAKASAVHTQWQARYSLLSDI